MSKYSARSPINGRFVKVDTDNTPVDSKFDRMTGIEVSAPSDVQDSPYELVRSDRNVVRRPVAPRVTDDLGTGSPLRARHPTMVHPDDEAKEYSANIHNAVLRSAARDAGPMDPSYYLASGE